MVSVLVVKRIILYNCGLIQGDIAELKLHQDPDEAKEQCSDDSVREEYVSLSQVQDSDILQ